TSARYAFSPQFISCSRSPETRPVTQLKIRDRTRRRSGSRRRVFQPETRSKPSSSLTSRDRKSTRLNSSHLVISYAVFCLKQIKVRRQPLAQVDGRRRFRLSGLTVAWRRSPSLDDWIAYIVATK